MRDSLAGARIVVMRPAGRGETLCRRIAENGGDAFFFPVIDIHPLPAPPLPARAPDWAIFASIAAVEHGLPRVRSRIGETRIAAIGAATANALRTAGVRVDAVPDREESEGLLELPAFHDMTGATVWIVRGRGGRGLLAETLRARGADVAFVEVYERRGAAGGAEPLLNRWRTHGIDDALIVTSRAILESLHAMLDAEGRRFLAGAQLVMPTERMLKLALEFDIRPTPIVATGASDDALIAALVNWWRGRRQDPR